MRRFVIGLFKFSAAIVATFAIVIPALILGGCAIWYLVRCALTLASPGVPVKLSYQGQGGVVIVTARSYSVDPINLTALVRGLRVRDDRGYEHVSVERLLVRYSKPRVLVDVDGVTGRLDRLQGMKFSFQAALPIPSKSEEESIYEVNATSVFVRYSDASAAPVLRQPVYIPSLTVSGAGDRFEVRADVNLPGIGKLPILVARDESKRLVVSSRLSQAELSKALPHIERWINLRELEAYRPISVASARLTGPVKVAVNAKGDYGILANIDARYRGLYIGQWVQAGNGTLSAALRGRQARTIATIKEPARSTNFDGSVDFQKSLLVVGNVDMAARNGRALWEPLRKVIPRELTFSNARYTGVARYTVQRFALNGKLSAASARWVHESLSLKSIEVYVDNDRLVASRITTNWKGAPLKGAVAVNFSSGEVFGFAESGSVDIEKIGKQLGLDGFHGVGKAQAIFGGNTKKPTVTVAASGALAYRQTAERDVYLGLFTLRSIVTPTTANIERFAISGPNGAATGSGVYKFAGQDYHLSGTAGGLRVEAFQDQAKGLAFLQGTLQGKGKSMSYSGDAEIFGGEYDAHYLPITTAHFKGDETQVTAEDFKALIGAAKAAGSATLTFKDHAISGELSAEEVSLSEWFGSDIAGFAKASSVKLDGTLEKPKISAEIEARDVVAYDVAIDSIMAFGTFENDIVEVQTGTVRIGKGSASFGGQYSLDRKLGNAQLTFDQLPLARIQFPDTDLGFGGTASGAGNITVDDSGLTSAKLDTKIIDLSVNGEQIGDGSLAVALNDKLWTVDGALGEVDPASYISISKASFDEESRAVSGEIDVLGVPIAQIVRGLRDKLQSISADTRDLIQTASGSLSASVKLGGTLDDPQADLRTFALNDLASLDHSLGDVSAAGHWRKGVWTIDRLNWKHKDSSLVANGFIDENADLKLEGELANFDIGLLSLVAPRASSFMGRVDVSFLVSGQTRNPEGVGSLGLKNLGYISSDGKAESLPLNASLDTIELRDHKIRALGAFSYEDFAGILNANVPLSSFLSADEPDREPFDAKVELRERDLKEFTNVFTWMDPQRTQGTLGGSLSLKGFPDQFEFDGSLLVRNAMLAATGVDTSLRNLNLDATIDRSSIKIKGEGDSSSSGSLRLDTRINLPSSLDGVSTLADFLQQSTLSGSVEAMSLGFAQNPRDRNKVIAGTIDGGIELGGTLLDPVLSGIADQPIVLSNVNAVIPSEFAPQRDREPGLVNPRFNNIRAVTKQPATVKASSSSLALSADASLNGTLQSPTLLAAMNVVYGTFNLPTSRISLEPGGTLRFSYQGSMTSTPVAKLDVNLDGVTYVSALKLTDIVDRYRIELEITGNLLEDNGITIRANSDPPGLSQDEILALIGQTSLIESLTNNALNRRFGSELGSAIYGLAVPTLLNPFTSELASNLKLDYINIEYNSLDNFSIAAAKSLGGGFTIFGRRQLSNPVSGKRKYELKLTYRLPIRSGELSRVALGIGFDQDRPWKLSLNYGRRF